jgi:hypothetical protein
MNAALRRLGSLLGRDLGSRLATGLLLATCVAGCGHPATAAECEEIADRVTKLELAATPAGRDADTAKEQLERTRSWVKESQLKSCVGRRITDAALECVRGATKASEITDHCFR